MRFDVLEPVIEELAPLLSGARVERVLQGAAGIHLLCRKSGKSRILLLSPQRTLPRMHLVSRKPQSAADPHPFVLQLRSRLAGATVNHVILLNEDRIVEMLFQRNNAPSRLIFELTGSSANLFLADAENTILALYYPAPAAGAGARALVPGIRYVLPPKKPQPAALNQDLPDADLSPNLHAEEYYARRAEETRTAALRNRLRAAGAKARKRVERRLEALYEDLRSAQRADEYRDKGNLVLANIGQITPGSTGVELGGYDGNRFFVDLDPRISPAKNAERYFRKYKKAKAALPIVILRQRRAEEERSFLQSMETSIDAAADLNSLLRLKDELEGERYVRGKAAAKQREAGDMPGVRKVLFRGWEILVGRSAAGNDYVTTKLARPEDLWLHAEGLPGSHVLVRCRTREEIPPDVLLRASSLAAYYSRGKAAQKVSVVYTRARHVKKPKGAKPGLVVLSQRKTIVVKPEGETAT